jgi:hypothetical protein
MAIDRNALDAITGERKGKKNQSRFEDRPKPPKGVGERLYESVAKIPGAIAGIPGKVLDVVEGQKSPGYDVNQSARRFENLVTKNLPEAAGKIPETIVQAPGKAANIVSNYDVGKAARNLGTLVTENLPKALGEAPGKIADIVSNYIDGRKPQPGNRYTGVMTRDVPKPGIGQVGVGGSMPIPPAIAGDRAALAATERMRPAQSPSPFKSSAEEQANAPTVKPLTPSYVQSDAANKRDSLRAQIASEQQRMLTARRTAEGARRRGVEIEPFNEGASLKKIAEMRSELAGYEKAATPAQQIKIKTAEQNLATEQDVSRQAADIMQRDVDDLRYQLDLMPEGQAKAAMQERLRSLEYQQQQQSARGRVLAPTEAGPQVRGASPELYQQMLQEGEARTQRQREAAPRVAARQEALGEAAYRAAEGQQSGRLQAQQRQADFERAMQEATIAEIGAPERRRQLEEQTIQSKLGIETEESKARVAKMQAETGLTNVQARAADNAIKSLASREDITKRSAEADIEAKTLANLFNREKLKAVQEGRGYDPEVAAMKDAAVARSMNKLGITPEAEKGVTMAAEALKANIGRSVTGATVYSIPTDAIEDVKRAAQMNSYVLGLKALYDQGGDAKDIATNKARLLFNMFTGPIEGQRISGGTYASNIGTAAATGAATVGAIGFGVGSAIGTPLAGGPAGAGFGALVGGGSAAAGSTAITAGADLLIRTGLMTNAEAEGVKTNFNQMYATLQQMAQ